MDNSTHRVIFQGEVLAGETVTEVQKRIGDLLKIDDAKRDALFSGKTAIIKKNAALATCGKIKEAFAARGAVCRIEPETGPKIETRFSTPIQTPTGPPPLPVGPELKSQGNIAAPPGGVGEQFCSRCGTRIQLNALACPGCGKKVKKKDSLPGCAIAAIGVGVFFVVIAIVGILAAIAIPNFIAYRNKAFQAEVKAELHHLSRAQEAYYSEHARYTMDLAQLDYQRSDGPVRVEIVRADENCFEAKGSSPSLHKTYWIDCHGKWRETDKASDSEPAGGTDEKG